ncbi:MAG: T9SS type A sorting domain-containing protein [Bacteroidetes bacterium]|nr:T9SS type A sorting domain-containing protein [Bacteroidota bacterium]
MSFLQFPDGIYFIQLYTNTTIFTHKIIKQ